MDSVQNLPPEGAVWPGTFGAHLPHGEGKYSFRWPSITIVTPSLNQIDFLEETLQSILLQGYPKLELIVIDGGSSDGSVEIIQKYEPWLAYWQSVPDRGQYDALQNGFARSSGGIMAYLNSDDLYFPWTLRVVAEIFETFPQVDWLTTSLPAAISSDTRGPVIQSRLNRSSRWFFSNRGKSLFYKGFIQQESTFWRRSLWERAGARIDYGQKLAGDFELWSRFYQYTNPVTVNIPLGIFRYHESQKTAHIGRYIAEANKVLNSYPKPLWVPSMLIRVMNFIYRSANTEKNWLGARCDRVTLDPVNNRWRYIKSLEWRDL